VLGHFYNPNIHPYREFRARVDAYGAVAEKTGVHARIEAGYGLETFMGRISAEGAGADVFQAKSDARCRMCYRLRLEKTAEACIDAGIRTFSTTLLASPYQRHDMIKDTGESVAADYGLAFRYRDFRPGFRQGQAMAREMGLYMQGYCGCVFSEYERYGGGA
jgi:predicted adenine nucleotide alpha hydrolase (AANH) superfamily ATPase